jgi:hypothetical protein
MRKLTIVVPEITASREASEKAKSSPLASQATWTKRAAMKAGD